MKRSIIITPVLFLSIFFIKIHAQESDVFSSDLKTEKKPWTHLNFENNPDNFQFAIVTDRTGGPRPGIFEDAVMKLNWLRPEFVVSVGDLIKGAHGMDSVNLKAQWGRHFERIKPLKMPFFHLAGNHDIKANNQYQVDYWNKMFGTPFYSFKYKGVLFLGLFSNEGFQTMSDKQVEYFSKVLEENQDVRWTMVFMHHPLWDYPHFTNFGRLEKLLEGRKHSVFAGHRHRYEHFSRNGGNYYVLATTGGGSGLLGNSFGMFDHITWITMTDEGPSMANLRLDGILPHDVSNAETKVLARALIKGVFFESNVFVDSPKKFKQGKALLTYNNTSDLPLFLSGRFYHNHYVKASPDRLDVEIPPHSKKTVEIDLKAIEAFGLEKKVMLQFDGNLSYRHPEYKDLKLSGTQTIKIEQSSYDIITTEYADFVKDYTLKMNEALPGTKIHYTTDGSEPTQRSAVYTSPLSLDKEAIVKAALISEDGMSSITDEIKLSPVEAGKGVICKYYENDIRRDRWFMVPNFAELQPKTIKVSQSLKLEDAGKRNDAFGAVYKGFIQLPESGTYKFSTISDDGSILFVDGKQLITDAVKHKPREVFGEIELEKGKHALEWHFYQDKKGMAMDIFYETPSGKKVKVDISMLSYGEDQPEASWEFSGDED